MIRSRRLLTPAALALSVAGGVAAGARPHASGWADGPRAGVLPADDDAAA